MRPRALPLGGLLDRYVTRLFALSYGAAFFLVVGLFLIIDMATKLDDYVSADAAGHSATTLEVLGFYGLQLPFLYLQMSPYVTLIAGLFTAARLARSNEVVAALNAGISARRLLLPVYLGAGGLALGMFALREQATESLGRQRNLVQDRLSEQRPVPVLESLVVRDRGGRLVTLSEYHVGRDPADSVAYGLGAQYRLGDSTIRTTAAEARPLGGGRWELRKGRRIVDDGRERQTREQEVLDDLRFTPADVELAWKVREHPLDLSWGELSGLLDREPSNLQYLTLLQYTLTFPLAGLILLLVGLPFVLGAERGKAGERVARGFLLCICYFGVDFVARTMGMQGVVGPVFSGWLPLVLFGSLGSVLTASMRS